MNIESSFCYGIVAMYNIKKEKKSITANTFIDELCYLNRNYSKYDIEKLYFELGEKDELEKYDLISFED